MSSDKLDLWMRTTHHRSLWTILALLGLVLGGNGTLCGSDKPESTVASVDAGIGPCSIEFTVKDAKGAPVYNAKVSVHIAYGFVGMRRINLEVGTNSEGKARFDGLPERIKQPLTFHAAEKEREGEKSYPPFKECPAKQDVIVLEDQPKAATN